MRRGPLCPNILRLALVLITSCSSKVIGPRHSRSAASAIFRSASFISSPAHPGDVASVSVCRYHCITPVLRRARCRSFAKLPRETAGSRFFAMRMDGSRSRDGEPEYIGMEADLDEDQAFIEQIQVLIREGKQLLGAQKPDRRVLDEAINDLETGIRMLKARVQAEEDVDELSRLVGPAESTVDDMRRLSYNAPSPWQLSLPTFSPPRSKAAPINVRSGEDFKGLNQNPGGRGIVPNGPRAVYPEGGSDGESGDGLAKVGQSAGRALSGSTGGIFTSPAASGQGLNEVILRGEKAVNNARRLMGFLDASQSVRQEMVAALDELASVLSAIDAHHKDSPRAVITKTSVETAEEQLRELMYKLPPAAPQLPSFTLLGLTPKPDRPPTGQGTTWVTRSRQSLSAEEAGQMLTSGKRRPGTASLPRNLSGIRSLPDLLNLVRPLAMQGGLSGCDAATAMNQLKRLSRQAQDESAGEKVDNVMAALAESVIADVPSLQPRHIALALNAIADHKTLSTAKDLGTNVEIGSMVPWRWKKGREFEVSQSYKFAQGEPVVVMRSDGSSTFGCVDNVEGDKYLVRVSNGIGDAAFFRREKSATLGKLLLTWAARKLQRRELCLSIGGILMDNRQLLQRSSARDLAATLWSHAKLNAINDALFLAAGNQLRKEGVLAGASPQDLASILWAHGSSGRPNRKLFKAVGERLLETECLDSCNEQDVSLLLWAHARLKYWDSVVCQALAARVATITFTNSQAASNTLWALAELNMVDGYESSVKAVCEQIEDGGLARLANAQGSANMLWALSVMGMQESRASKKLLDSILPKSAFLDVADKCQLHQFFVSQRLCGSSSDEDQVDAALEFQSDDDEMDKDIEMLRADCASAFVDASSRFQRPSKIQAGVSQLVSELGIAHFDEHVLPGIGYSIDIWLPALNIAIEVEGPNHFVSGEGNGRGLLTGASVLKRRHLRAWGVKLVCLAYYVLDDMALRQVEDRKRWLLGEIEGAK